MSISETEIPTPLLTVVLTGRNDDYNTDNLVRIQRTLNFSGYILEKLNALEVVEFLFVDFKSKNPIATAIYLQPHAYRITKFIEVPLGKDFSDMENSHAPDDFLSTVALSIGCRRAKGKFISVQGLDLFMSFASWRNLLDILNGRHSFNWDIERCTFLVPRKSIKGNFFSRVPSLNYLNRWLSLQPHTLPFMRSNPFIGSGMGALICSRELFYEMGGHDERFNKWGYNDIDFALRASILGPLVDLGEHGVTHYKPAYSDGGARQAILKDRNAMNPHWINTNYRVNSEEWGSVNEEFPETKSNLSSQSSDNSLIDPFQESIFSDFKELAEGWDGRISDDYVASIIVSATNHVSSIYSYLLYKLKIIAWICTHRNPLKILIAGNSQNCYQFETVAISSPISEIYVLEFVDSPKIGNVPNVVISAENLINRGASLGYFRAMISNGSRGLKAIIESESDGFQPELVIIDLDNIGERPEIFLQLLSSVTTNSFYIIYSSTSAELFFEASCSIKSIFKIEPVLAPTGNAGLAVICR